MLPYFTKTEVAAALRFADSPSSSVYFVPFFLVSNPPIAALEFGSASLTDRTWGQLSPLADRERSKERSAGSAEGRNRIGSVALNLGVSWAGNVRNLGSVHFWRLLHIDVQPFFAFFVGWWQGWWSKEKEQRGALRVGGGKKGASVAFLETLSLKRSRATLSTAEDCGCLWPGKGKAENRGEKGIGRKRRDIQCLVSLYSDH